MSHIVTIKTEIRDRQAVEAACRRLALDPPIEGAAQLFSDEVAGLLVQLPGWSYPVVCDMATGQVHYDNFAGRWGEQAELNRLLQAYAVERAKIEARRQGHRITEHQLADGSIRLSIQVGGAT